MEKKKVLFVATVVKTHMMQFHIPYLKMFQDMGWETAVASRNDYENPEDCRIPYCDTYYDIPFERLPWKRGNIKAYKLLKSIIDGGNYDIIHCHTPVGAMIARLAALSARKKGTKVIYTAHGFHFFKGAPLLNWLLFFPAEWLLAPVTDVLITINNEDYERAKRILKAKRVEFVPGVGIDLAKFQQNAPVREDKRRELGYGEKDFLLLTVAEMTANKNHITTLKALALLKDRPEFSDIHYLICGRGEQWPTLEAAAREMGISDHVNFLGYRSDAPQLYHAGDVFVFPTFREGLSVALMEAMASGMTIVCTQIRGNVDLIQDEKTGLFMKFSPEDLAEKILRLYHDRDLCTALGKAAEEKAQDYGEEAVHKRMKEIYLSV